MAINRSRIKQTVKKTKYLPGYRKPSEAETKIQLAEMEEIVKNSGGWLLQFNPTYSIEEISTKGLELQPKDKNYEEAGVVECHKSFLPGFKISGKNILPAAISNGKWTSRINGKHRRQMVILYYSMGKFWHIKITIECDLTYPEFMLKYKGKLTAFASALNPKNDFAQEMTEVQYDFQMKVAFLDLVTQTYGDNYVVNDKWNNLSAEKKHEILQHVIRIAMEDRIEAGTFKKGKYDDDHVINRETSQKNQDKWVIATATRLSPQIKILDIDRDVTSPSTDTEKTAVRQEVEKINFFVEMNGACKVVAVELEKLLSNGIRSFRNGNRQCLPQWWVLITSGCVTVKDLKEARFDSFRQWVWGMKHECRNILFNTLNVDNSYLKMSKENKAKKRASVKKNLFAKRYHVFGFASSTVDEKTKYGAAVPIIEVISEKQQQNIIDNVFKDYLDKNATTESIIFKNVAE
jgi:hypothetical protein